MLKYFDFVNYVLLIWGFKSPLNNLYVWNNKRLYECLFIVSG